MLVLVWVDRDRMPADPSFSVGRRRLGEVDKLEDVLLGLVACLESQDVPDRRGPGLVERDGEGGDRVWEE